MVPFPVVFCTMFIKNSLNFLAISLRSFTVLSPISRAISSLLRKHLNVRKGLTVFQICFLVPIISFEVVLFRVFVKILKDTPLLRKCQNFSRDAHFVHLFLSLDLFIIALLSSFFTKCVSLPLTIFFLYWSILSRTILKIFVKTSYWGCFSL